jgi:aspartyl-tRNA(Asn)/glutamyl-tRNA(Gln) amidotransferase subunit A
MEAFEAALETARSLGATVERVALPHADFGSAPTTSGPGRGARATWPASTRPPTAAGAADAATLVSMYTQTRHDGFGAEVKRRVMLGTYALSSATTTPTTDAPSALRTKIS